MDLQDFLKGAARGDVEKDDKGIALFDPRVHWQEEFAPCAVPYLHLYILIIVLDEANSALTLERLRVFATGVLVPDYSV